MLYYLINQFMYLDIQPFFIFKSIQHAIVGSTTTTPVAALMSAAEMDKEIVMQIMSVPEILFVFKTTAEMDFAEEPIAV